ncbi:MAG: hypothetical protein PUD92_04125 [Clostridiales bacterium]|nr:hypothetical protein [Clostridiales bacterium]
MKKFYFEPEMEISSFSTESIVTVSELNVTSDTTVETALIPETALKASLDYLSFTF